MRRLWKLALGSALATCLLTHPSSASGPGFGNLTYTNAELFKEVSVFDNSNGTPTDSPSKAYGHNVALLLDGYLAFTFAPDSGLASGGWLVYDVSDPREPSLVHTHRGSDTAQLREPHSLPIAIVGEKTYVATQMTFGVQIWDMTDPLSPASVGSLSLSGVNGGDYTDVSWQLSWQWPYLYVAGGNRGIYIVDTRDMTKPTFVRQVQTSQLGGFRVGPIFALGDQLFLANMDESARYSLLDLREPTEPALIDTIGTTIRYYSMAVSGNLIVGAGRDGDLLVHEVRAGSIESVASHRIEGDGLYLAFQDDFIHYGQTASYKKLTFSDPRSVSIVGNTHLVAHDADHGQTTPFGNLVFLGNDHGSGSALVPHQAAPDSTPPKVTWSFPANSAVNQPNETVLAATFSDNVDPATLRGGNVRLEAVGGGAVTGAMTYLFNTLHFRADAPLAEDTTYRFTISTGVKDVMGNPLEAEHQIVFSTGPTTMGAGGAGGSAGQGNAGGGNASGAAGAPGGGGQSGLAGSGGMGAGRGGAPAGGSGMGGSTGGLQAGGGQTSGFAGAAGLAGIPGMGGSSFGGAGKGAGGAPLAGAPPAAGGSLSTGGTPAAGGSEPASDPGGCGCRATGSQQGGARGTWLLLALAGTWFGVRRRR